MDLEADQQEDERVQRERDVVPERRDRDARGGARSRSRGVVPAQHPRGHGGEDAGEAEVFRGGERAVGGDRRHGYFDHRVVDAMNHERAREADDGSDEDAHPEDEEKVERGGRDRRRPSEHEGEHEREDDDRGPVVEEALPPR